MQILLWLPVKSLMRFKLVSKHWKSLITSHRFSLVRYPNPAVGLLIPVLQSTLFNYIPLDVTNPTEPPFRELEFPGDPFSYWIQQSCNGLLLCCSFVNLDRWFSRYPPRSCCVYNPTTKCFTKLPRLGFVDKVQMAVYGLNLAFDPAKSSLYKVICIRSSGFACEIYQIEMYSSESGVWRVSGEPFSDKASFGYGVYGNGSIHWIDSKAKELLYFSVNNEKIGKMSLPASMRRIVYFGESCDHVHVIDSFDPQMALNVYEMKRDYSEWFVKCRVDVTTAAVYFPEPTNVNALTDRIRYRYAVLSRFRSWFCMLTVRSYDSH